MTALEIGAVSHCNIACAGCSRCSPASRAEMADPGRVLRDLTALHTTVSCKVLRVTGGEPLLHPDLKGLLKAIRRSGIARCIQLLTNGTLLHKRSLDWVDYVDMIQIAHYPGCPLSAETLKKLKRFCALKGKGLNVRNYHSFRLFHPKKSLSARERVDIFETCQASHAWSCHQVKKGRVYLCLPSLACKGREADFCRIKPLNGLRERLADLLYSRKPLAVCRKCLGTVGNIIPHRQVPLAQWLKVSRQGFIDRSWMAKVRDNPWMESNLYDTTLDLPWKGEPPKSVEWHIDWKAFFASAEPPEPAETDNPRRFHLSAGKARLSQVPLPLKLPDAT